MDSQTRSANDKTKTCPCKLRHANDLNGQNTVNDAS